MIDQAVDFECSSITYAQFMFHMYTFDDDCI